MKWQEEFREAVARTVIAKGTPARSSDIEEDYGYFWDWTYGYYHSDYQEILDHKKTCAFVATGAVQPVEWSEFQDTDADNLHKHGLIAVCSCSCGLYKDITFVYESSLYDLLQDLLRKG